MVVVTTIFMAVEATMFTAALPAGLTGICDDSPPAEAEAAPSIYGFGVEAVDAVASLLRSLIGALGRLA